MAGLSLPTTSQSHTLNHMERNMTADPWLVAKANETCSLAGSFWFPWPTIWSPVTSPRQPSPLVVKPQPLFSSMSLESDSHNSLGERRLRNHVKANLCVFLMTL